MKPGLLSGVCSGFASTSIDASQGGIVADLPRPFASNAASKAHFLFTDVINALTILTVKVSQNVSSTGTPFTFKSNNKPPFVTVEANTHSFAHG
jgi:hypothetical protein